MKEWDLGKIAGQVVGGIWSSVRDWDYFTRDSLGQQVRASADSLWNIHPSEDAGKPPESEFTEITIEAVTEDETGDFSPSPSIPSSQPNPEQIQPNLNSPNLNPPISSPTSSHQSPVLRNPESYQYFITEAQDLLVQIEEQVFNLNRQKDTAQIYSLMRATHTLKGASANVGQETIKTIAHNLEDVFRAMLSPEAVIDPELESMLFEGYECLRLALSAELAHEYGQTDDLLNRAADLFARFEEKLGDCFQNPAPLPSSSEMGFDLTRSIFEMGVEQRLSELKGMLENPESSEHLLVFLEESAEVFLGLGESLGLSGFCAIAQSTLNALSYHPDAVLEIAPLVYQDFYQAQQAVFAGDRTQGGTPSPQLLQWSGASLSDEAPLPEDFGELEYLEDSQDFAPSDAILLDTTAPTERPHSPPADPPQPESWDLDPLAPFDPPEALEDPEFLGDATPSNEDIFTLDPLELVQDPFNSSELWDEEEIPLEDSFDSGSESPFNPEAEETTAPIPLESELFHPQNLVQPDLDQELNQTVSPDRLELDVEDLDSEKLNNQEIAPNVLDENITNPAVKTPEIDPLDFHPQETSYPSHTYPDFSPSAPESSEDLEQIFLDDEYSLDIGEDDLDYSLDLSDYAPNLEPENEGRNTFIFPENIAPIPPVKPTHSTSEDLAPNLEQTPQINEDFLAPVNPEEDWINAPTFAAEAEEIAPLIDFSPDETSLILDPDDFSLEPSRDPENLTPDQDNFIDFTFTETAPEQPTEDLYSDLEWTDPAAEMAEEEPLESLPETAPSPVENEEELDYGQTSPEIKKEQNITQETSIAPPESSPPIDKENPDHILFGDDWNNSEQLDTVPSIEDTFGRLELEPSLAEFDADELFLIESEPEPTPEPSQTPSIAPVTPLQQTSQPTPLKAPSPPPAAPAQSTPQPVSTKTLRLELEQLEHINHLVGELLINQNQLTLRDEQFQGAVQKLSDWLKKHRFTLTQLRDYIAEYKNEDQKKLTPTQRLLYSALEETSQITQATEDISLLSRTTTSTIEREKRISKQLRDNIQSARMVPLKTLLKRFPPMVKQLSFVHKKEVELALKGTEVMVDKTITENLYDALLHLIRNAFDHGIESPEIRQKLGKPTTGQLEINAYNQGNRTIIELRDDGQGLNIDKICQKALHKRLITEVEAERIKQLLHPEDRLLELMCMPGFSTAEQVSDLSGRGVGLDVVQTQLANIKGYLSVRSFPQQGTIFYVQIRESLMSARLLICRAKNSIYGFVSNEIEQVLIPGDNLRWLAGQKVLDWEQKGEECTIPVYELSSLFHYSGHSLTHHQSLLFHESSEQGLSPLLRTPDNVPPVLLLRTTEGLIGLEVDQVIEEQELVIKPISSAIAPPPYLYGCSILADGRLTLILDGAALLQQAQKKGIRVLDETEMRSQFSTPFTVDVSSSPLSTQQLGLFVAPSEDTTDTEERRSANLTPKAGEGQAPSPPTQNTILVVDDSLTERQTLTLILQRNGYKIIQSKDGLEALEALKTAPEVKMILCDIEMPRMNGLEFLSRLQQDKTLPHPPVVMLTSRSRDKFQHIAMSLGAYAYLTKPYLEQEILSTLEEAIHDLIPPAR